jgi:hypothetical protein
MYDLKMAKYSPKHVVYVIYYNYRVIHISHLIVVVLFKLFAKTEKITMEDSYPQFYPQSALV